MIHRIRLIVACALTCALFFAACSAGGSPGGSSTASTSGTSSTGSSTSTTSTTTSPAPTATMSKPTSVPTMTLAECQSLLSIAEANQILSPGNTINSITPSNTSGGGSCNYDYATDKIVMYLFFQPYTGIPLSTLVAAAESQNFKGISITTNQQVNGVGDQAWFLAGHGSKDGITGYGDILYVVDGAILFTVNYESLLGGALGSNADASVESEFVHIAQLVVSRL
jgi:hypothetical protein